MTEPRCVDALDIQSQPEEMNMEVMRHRIRSALRNSNDYRTVGGIARSTDLTREEVREVLDAHPHEFRKAPYRIAGKELFSLSEQHEPAMV